MGDQLGTQLGNAATTAGNLGMGALGTTADILLMAADPRLFIQLKQAEAEKKAAERQQMQDPAYQALLGAGGPQAVQSAYGVPPPTAQPLQALMGQAGVNVVPEQVPGGGPPQQGYALPPTLAQLEALRMRQAQQAAPPGFMATSKMFELDPMVEAMSKETGQRTAGEPFDIRKEGRSEAQTTRLANVEAARAYGVDTGDWAPFLALQGQGQQGGEPLTMIRKGKEERTAAAAGAKADADAQRKNVTLSDDQRKRLDQIAAARAFISEWQSYGTSKESRLPASRVGGSGDTSVLGRVRDMGSALATQADQTMAMTGRDPFFIGWNRYKQLARPIIARNLGGDVGNLSESEQKAIDAVTSAISQPEVAEAAAQMMRLLDAREKELTAGKAGVGTSRAASTGDPDLDAILRRRQGR